MGISHGTPVAAALLILLCLIRTVATVLHADRRRVRRIRGRQHLRQLRRLDRALAYRIRPPRRPDDGPVVVSRPWTHPPTPARSGLQPGLAQIAAELRRLDQQRRGGLACHSQSWQDAVVQAYDSWLVLACRRLDVEQHLLPLNGLDRELERLRMQGRLQSAGLRLGR